MNSDFEKIIGCEKLTCIFGRWPSFHDGYIDEVHFEPHSNQGTLEIACRIFEMTNQTDERGYFILKNHTKTKIRFVGLERLELKAICAGVIISDFKFEPVILEFSKKPGWSAIIESSTDFELQLQCSVIEVLEAAPDLQPN